MLCFNADLSNYYHLEQKDREAWIIFKNHIEYARIPQNLGEMNPNIIVSPNEQYLVVLTPRTIYFILSDVASQTFEIEADEIFRRYVFTRDSRYFVISIRNQGILIYYCNPVTRVVTLEHEYPSRVAFAIAASPDSKFLYLGDQKVLRKYEFGTQHTTAIWDGTVDPFITNIHTIAVSPDGTKIAGVFHDQSYRYYLLCDDMLHFAEANKILIERWIGQRGLKTSYPLYQHSFPGLDYLAIHRIFFAPDNTTLYFMTQQNILFRWMPFHKKLQHIPTVTDVLIMEILHFNAIRTACAIEPRHWNTASSFKIQAISDFEFTQMHPAKE